MTTIQGGVGINTVPDRATISIDRRIGPGENPEAAYADLVRYIAEHANLGVARLDHDPPFMKSSGLSDANNRPLAERLTRLVRDAGRDERVRRRAVWHRRRRDRRGRRADGRLRPRLHAAGAHGRRVHRSR